MKTEDEKKETGITSITSDTSNTSIALTPEQQMSVAIDNQVAIVLADKSVGIAKALVIARAMEIIDSCLTPQIMEPIMKLQGSKLGFKTDKDFVRDGNNNWVKGTGYPLDVVKTCFTEMSLIGLQPVFNQWNIIGGNSYVTKEGSDTLLKSIPYLQQFSIIHDEVNQSVDKKTASVKSTIKWVIDGEEHTQVVSHPVKSDAYTTLDSLVGKADRKTKIWLFNKIKGTSISDGDAEEAKIIDITPVKPNIKEESEKSKRENILDYISKATDEETLAKCYKAIGDDPDLLIVYEDKKRSFTKKATT